MPKNYFFKIILVFTSFFAFQPITFALPQQNPSQTIQKAYIYAYPLVLMGTTNEVMTNVIKPDQPSRAPVNQLLNVREFPRPDMKDVIRPNVDTLYSMAWLDLSKEPMVLVLPDSNGRYYLIQMLDAWSDVFASLGKRTTGTKPNRFAIVGPNWKGALPTGVKKISSPTNLVWIIGRTQTNGVADYENVHQFQNGLKLLPLSQLDNPNYQPPYGKIDTTLDDTTPPPKQVAEMDIMTFFKEFAELLKSNPPDPTDQKILSDIKQIGLIPGKEFNTEKFTSDEINTWNQAGKMAAKKIAESKPIGSQLIQGWLTQRNNIGTYDNNYLARAVIARQGLGANLPQDAIYSSATVDSNNQPLTGKNNYLLHFNKNQLPPVRAFWSLTLYDAEGYFAPNSAKRYALGDRDPLQYNKDGSLDIYIQHAAPEQTKLSNWLPAPNDKFNLLMRLYWPKSAILSGHWSPPAIKKIDHQNNGSN